MSDHEARNQEKMKTNKLRQIMYEHEMLMKGKYIELNSIHHTISYCTKYINEM